MGAIVKGVLAGMAMLAVAIWVFDEPEPRPIPSQAAVDWLVDYYETFPIGGGWNVTGVQSEPGRLRVMMTVPAATEGVIRNAETDRRLAITRTACPNSNEAIWSLVSAEIELEMVNQAFNAYCPRP
jgi:hypothetical protein